MRRREVVLVIPILAAVLGGVVWSWPRTEWWANALSMYGVFLLLAAAQVGTYAGWAADEVEDDREARQLGVVVVAIVVLVPAILVLGRQALGTSISRAPGRWPRAADAVARVVTSAVAGALDVAFLVGLVRGRLGPPRMAIAGVCWAAMAAWLAAWPWMLPLGVAARGAIAVALMVVALIVQPSQQELRRLREPVAREPPGGDG